MQNQSIIKPTKFFAFIISIVMAFDGFSALAFGGLYLFISMISDPADFKIETKYAIVHQGEFVAFLTFLYLVICYLSPIYWAKGKMLSSYIMLGLALLHLAGFSYLFRFRDEFNMFTYLFYGSLISNLSLLAIVVFTQIEARFFMKQ